MKGRYVKELKRERELLLHAIKRIEGLAGDDFCSDLEMMAADMGGTLKTDTERFCAEKLMAIYRAAHSVDRSHSCFHVHADWRKEVKDALAEWKREGI